MSSNRPTPKQRRLVAARAKFRCEYCLIPVIVSTQPFNVDHIIPSSKGGVTKPDNLAFSCGCNNYKSDYITAPDPQNGELVLLFHPRQQLWADHFGWSENSLQIIGRTPTGRATISQLRMNRDELVELRKLLLPDGRHPPTD